MTLRLVVTARDESLEKLLQLANAIAPQRAHQITLFERAIFWLRASDRCNYGFTHRPEEISACLLVGDTQQPIDAQSDTEVQLRQEKSSAA